MGDGSFQMERVREAPAQGMKTQLPQVYSDSEISDAGDKEGSRNFQEGKNR
jgi:hypothetical protein